jgi:predicted ATPase/DNA-binding SARP family transcriptional activator/Tfp pilus assembly protein PilF
MLEVTLLGQFEVLQDGKRLTIPTRNAQSLFAYLLLNAGQSQRRERLAGLLWPDSSEENARSNLRHELWRLRKAFETNRESYFLIDNLSLAFNPHSPYCLDVQELECVPLEDSTVDDLIAAVSVYGGELLPGFYDEWVFAERDRLHPIFEAKMARLLELLQAEGRWSEVLEWGMRWIGVGQWPEPAYRALISAYANSGDMSKAMATYRRLVQGLQKDLGAKPSEQTQALYKRLKAGWKPEAQAQLTPLVIQPTADAADQSAPAAPLPRMRRSNLPRPLTSFIGREKEIQQVKRLVSEARLVTITGSGGVGKTRLAIQVAGALASQFRDGVWWVELAALFDTSGSKKRDSSPDGDRSWRRDSQKPPVELAELTAVDMVAQAVAKALRVPVSPSTRVLEAVLEHLRDRRLLLVLDNCEHLITACAALTERILQDCPGVTILATSREALGVAGEKCWLLSSLSLPESGPASEFKDIVQSEAVSLFIERTAEILPGYQPDEAEAATIAQVCRRLDGMPLAIELAAARMKLLSATEIASWLDQRFNLLTAGRRTALPRHRTLRAAIEWSYDLLDQTEQALFRRLSIFAGSFTLEAAQAVCTGGEIHPDETLTLLGRLMDKSLLQVDPAPRDAGLATRYRFLDSIGSFGRLKLDEAGESGHMRDRHAEYYVRLAEAAEPELLLSDQGFWNRLLLAEHDNIRAMVEWSAESDQAENAVRVVGALLWFWWSHGSMREGLNLTLQALALPSAAQFERYRARALNTACFLRWVLGDMESARQNIEEALSIFRKSNDEAGLAWSILFLGVLYTSEGQYDLANAALQDGISIARKLGDLNKSSFSLAFMGDVALQQGDRSKAKRVYEESADMLRSLGNKLFLAYPLRRLGYLALERNDVSQAWHYFRESLALNREGGDRRAVAACLTSFAALALHLDKPAVAARLYGAVERRMESLSNLLYLDQAELGRVMSKLLSTLNEASFEAALTEGWELSVEQAIELAEQLVAEEQ